MKKQDDSDTTISNLMDWVHSPDDVSLTRQAKQVLDSQFDDPKAVFSIAELAMAHREVGHYPMLDQAETALFGELLREERRVHATNTDLVAMGRLILDRKKFAIQLAGESGISEKPKIEIRVTPDGDDDSASAAKFTPKQRERMRRALAAITSK